MLHPLILQQILDALTSPPSHPSSVVSSTPVTTPHTALLVLKDSGSIYAASSRYNPTTNDPHSSSSSSFPSSNTSTPQHILLPSATPNPIFRGLLCPRDSSSSPHGSFSLEERNRNVATLSWLAWNEKIRGSSSARGRGGGGHSGDHEWTFRSSQYGLLHIRPLRPLSRGKHHQHHHHHQHQHRHRQHRPSNSSYSSHRTRSSTIINQDSKDSSSQIVGNGNEDDRYEYEEEEEEEDDDEEDEEEVPFLLVLNTTFPPTPTSTIPSSTNHNHTEEPSSSPGQAETTADDLAIVLRSLQKLAQLVAVNLAPGLRVVER